MPATALHIAQLPALFAASMASCCLPAYHRESTLAAYTIETIPNGIQQSIVVRIAHIRLLSGFGAGCCELVLVYGAGVWLLYAWLVLFSWFKLSFDDACWL